MQPQIQPRKTWEKYRRFITVATSAFALVTGKAAASHSSLNCSPPESLTPLLELLHALTELAFIGGVGIGTLGFMFAGIALAVPGQDWTRLGKQVIKQVFIGVVLLLSAQMIIDFLTSQMGGVIC